ncbi:MAG: McrC family protein [Bacteroidetes bacterium]|nr:McrC family protein [Bacteroidota bacterium]
MRTTDNNCCKSLSDCQYDEQKHRIDDLTAIANRSLIDLQEINPDLLIFPQSLGQYNDDVEKTPVFSLHDKKLTTYNLMGFVGKNNTQLTITSRFANGDEKDFFLHYMLQKVFAINLLKFDQTSNNENIWDFLLYLFPYYLKKAYLQGLFKAYKREDYNNANVKGTIDVKRHIRTNIPFAGKIAYTTREHSYDNNITQLIRHTIEHIQTHPFGGGILTSDSETRDVVSKFCFVTQNSYNKNARQKIISANLKPVSHPFFTEYKMLQKICLRILRCEKLSFGVENNKIYGLLFDGAWLWEEYLNKVFIEQNFGFIHAENKTGKNPIYLFENNGYKRFPDFYKSDFILDAKYKNLDLKNMDRNDLHQIIAYMYVQQVKLGGFIYPCKEERKVETVGILKGYGGDVRNWSVQIPQTAKNFADFQNKMKKNEENLRNRLNLA